MTILWIFIYSQAFNTYIISVTNVNYEKCLIPELGKQGESLSNVNYEERFGKKVCPNIKCVGFIFSVTLPYLSRDWVVFDFE